MAKRKLSRRQQWRVEKIQQERQQRAERKTASGTVEDLKELALGPEQEGLLVANYGASVEVEDAEAMAHRCQLRQNLPPLVTGDRVVWQPAAEGGVVSALLPRRSMLSRPDSLGELKPVAANIDQIMVVAAPAPEFSADLIDQYLAAAELTGITPILVFNKIDLVDDSKRQQVDELLQRYRRIGYTVLETSTKLNHGLDDLRQQLNNKTNVFVGQSGVGKSSLVKALLPQHEISIGELSQQSGLGQHTTSTSRLYHLPDGGTLIDSPGVRDFRLWSMNRMALAEGFREFAPFLGHCRFRDCRHESEPQCALREAVENGKISKQRLQSYLRLCTQLEESH
jgi:ribosome biogenesis GTPase / thiamine phosphate phosphatase